MQSFVVNVSQHPCFSWWNQYLMNLCFCDLIYSCLIISPYFLNSLIICAIFVIVPLCHDPDFDLMILGGVFAPRFCLVKMTASPAHFYCAVYCQPDSTQSKMTSFDYAGCFVHLLLTFDCLEALQIWRNWRFDLDFIFRWFGRLNWITAIEPAGQGSDRITRRHPPGV